MAAGPGPSAPNRPLAGGIVAPGHPATLIAGGQGQWAALGPSAIWTSRDGMAWTLASAQGIAPMRDGDQVNVLRRTAGGFLAVGENVPPGDPAAASPVVWTSANGVNWRLWRGPSRTRRPVAARLGLHLRRCGREEHRRFPCGHRQRRAGHGALVRGVAEHGRQRHDLDRGYRSGQQRGDRGGRRVAATANGLVAVRPGQSKAGAGAVVFTSADGAAWKFAATVTAQGGAGLTVATVDGGPAGAVITGSSAGNLLAFTSISGTAWRPVGVLGSATACTIAVVAVITGGAVVAAGSTAAGPLGQQPTLTLDNAGRLTPVNFARIPGAVEPQVAVNGIAADGSSQVAVAGDVVVVSFDHHHRVLPRLGPGASVLGQEGVEAERSSLFEVLSGQLAAIQPNGSSGPCREPLDDLAPSTIVTRCCAATATLAPPSPVWARWVPEVSSRLNSRMPGGGCSGSPGAR